MKYALLSLLLTAGSSLAGNDWNRYEIIMERAPFGKEPLLEESAEPARPAGEFAKEYRLCMLYEDSQGQLKAGIVSKVNNKNFFLQVGESSKEFSLVEIRLEEGIAILQQGGETAQLLLAGIGAPAVSISQREIAATASLDPGSPQMQSFRRSGMQSAPEHILAALTDSAPKQAGITVRKTQPVAFSGESSDPSDVSESNDTLISNESSKPFSAGTAKTDVAQVRAPANYLVQSVPQRYNPF